MMKPLEVFIEKTLIGTIFYNSDGEISFLYDSQTQDDLHPSVPHSASTVQAQSVQTWVDSLLPSPNLLKVLAKKLGHPAEDRLSFLSLLGGDMPGAYSFTSPPSSGQLFADSLNNDWRSAEDFATWMDELSRRPLLAGMPGGDDIRLCLPGSHEKLPVQYFDEHFRLPFGGECSSHVLKLSPRSLPGFAHNMSFCLALAQSLGLPSVASKVVVMDGTAHLLTQRHDRSILDKEHQIQALHCEDLCLGVDSRDFVALCQNWRAWLQPSALFISNALDRVIFHALIGDPDSSARRYLRVAQKATPQSAKQGEANSLGSARDYRPAPIHHAICAAAYVGQSVRLGTPIGGIHRLQDVRNEHWNALADGCGMSKSQVRRRVMQWAQRMPLAADRLLEQWSQDSHRSHHPVLLTVAQKIKERCQWIQTQ